MPWRRLIGLPDGCQVESRLAPSADEWESATVLPRYRVTPAEGAPILFSSLAQVSAYLARNYEIEVVARSVGTRIPSQRRSPEGHSGVPGSVC